MNTLPVSDETHARAVALQEADNMSSDSLVNLALDAFEMMVTLTTGRLDASGVPMSYREWERRFDGVREGQHYVEVAPRPALRGA